MAFRGVRRRGCALVHAALRGAGRVGLAAVDDQTAGPLGTGYGERGRVLSGSASGGDVRDVAVPGTFPFPGSPRGGPPTLPVLPPPPGRTYRAAAAPCSCPPASTPPERASAPRAR